MKRPKIFWLTLLLCISVNVHAQSPYGRFTCTDAIYSKYSAAKGDFVPGVHTSNTVTTFIINRSTVTIKALATSVFKVLHVSVKKNEGLVQYGFLLQDNAGNRCTLNISPLLFDDKKQIIADLLYDQNRDGFYNNLIHYKNP
ncbi:hypothetical protein [Mucilaginibacter ginkgonis]|uniref:Uncharacterized protein n=1 Tax=Mucilaginibacter ginkgonis TaxID=2682091 RepID=A0A6I4IP76_9SPHI|nr:hypothetical protein [Mucilaginibacter ginkgonis]QQL50517.1 hypothetical protein GO620_003415 [Mucilaginibacter ginkgonis]